MEEKLAGRMAGRDPKADPGSGSAEVSGECRVVIWEVIILPLWEAHVCSGKGGDFEIFPQIL